MCQQLARCTNKLNHVHCGTCRKIASSSPCALCVWQGRASSGTVDDKSDPSLRSSEEQIGASTVPKEEDF